MLLFAYNSIFELVCVLAFLFQHLPREEKAKEKT
ncbi:hypothetical protein LINPERPRIM_LOCUS8850, partial [Linum perenne]